MVAIRRNMADSHLQANGKLVRVGRPSPAAAAAAAPQWDKNRNDSQRSRSSTASSGAMYVCCDRALTVLGCARASHLRSFRISCPFPVLCPPPPPPGVGGNRRITLCLDVTVPHPDSALVPRHAVQSPPPSGPFASGAGRSPGCRARTRRPTRRRWRGPGPSQSGCDTVTSRPAGRSAVLQRPGCRSRRSARLVPWESTRNRVKL